MFRSYRCEKIFAGRRSGFGLLEVIIAVYLIVTGLLGVMSLVKYIIASVAISSSRLAAMHLAQEGIEIVRDIRDRQSNWDNFYTGVPDGSYAVQYNWTVFWPNHDADVLWFNPATGLYGYKDYIGGGAIETPFNYRRKIIIKRAPAPDNNADEMSVVSEVSWTVNGVARSIVVEDRLWKWLAPAKNP